jgi:UDP-glucose 4-epimerase
MNSVLVTGGAGFIGSHIVQTLINRGDNVRVLDNFSTGNAKNLVGLRSSLEVVEGDIRDIAKVKEAMQDIDYVFHQAAFVSVAKSMIEPQQCFDVNVQGTLNILNIALSSGVRRVIQASSTAIYGDSIQLPLVEETAARPLSPYAASKYTAEIYGGLYTRTLGLPVVSLRYFNVYGPRQSPTSDYAAAIPIFIHRFLDKKAPTVYGNGHQSRDFIYVNDIVQANLLAAEVDLAPGEVFNICTGHETTILDLLDVLTKIIPGSKDAEFSPARPGDIFRSLGNPTRATRVLGFQPQVSLVEGLSKTVAALDHNL